jgi:two-component system response regulator HydG
LYVFDICIPPLRERHDDILPLATAFLREFAGSRTALTPQAMEVLHRHEWPGDVRELRNAVERALILCEGEFIEPEHLRARGNRPHLPARDLRINPWKQSATSVRYSAPET